MEYVFYFFAAGWSLAIAAAWIFMLFELCGDSLLAGSLMIFVGGPLFFVMAALPWAFWSEQSSPDLVTLKKDAWACVASHTETTMVPISTGKTTTMVPQMHSVCDQYGRVR